MTMTAIDYPRIPQIWTPERTRRANVCPKCGKRKRGWFERKRDELMHRMPVNGCCCGATCSTVSGATLPSSLAVQGYSAGMFSGGLCSLQASSVPQQWDGTLINDGPFVGTLSSNTQAFVNPQPASGKELVMDSSNHKVEARLFYCALSPLFGPFLWTTCPVPQIDWLLVILGNDVTCAGGPALVCWLGALTGTTPIGTYTRSSPTGAINCSGGKTPCGGCGAGPSTVALA